MPVLLSCLLACSGGPPPERAAPPPAPVPVKTRPPAPPPPARPKPPTGPFVEPARPAEAPPVAGQIGTTGPITLLASTPDGHAAVVCQARVDSNRDGKIEVKAGMHGERFGDEMRPYLVIGDGPGLPLDAFHAIDPLGGRLVATRGDQLQLIDLSTGAAIVLGKPPARPEAHSPFTGGRVAAFDLDGKHMLYLRRSTRRDGQPDLVLRDQASGAETLVDWGRGRLWRAGFDGAFIEVEVADGSPRGMPPIHVRGDLDPSGGERCRGFYMEFGEWRRGGEELHRRFLRVGAGGPAAEIADLVEIFGDAVLRRQPDGGYALTDDAGTSVLVPASCGPVLLHVSGKLPAALVACTGGKPLAKDADGLDPELPLVIYDRAGAHPLGVSETIDADPGDAPIYKRSG
ncbi:MAG TPA: hypothetical protein VL172_14550, partial [Kofleriaceae bacterium]|nr:hypothetical protein [Kofleriaceae bacterium]